MAVEDPFASTVRDLFEGFLLNFSSEEDGRPTSNIEEAPKEYIEQVRMASLSVRAKEQPS